MARYLDHAMNNYTNFIITTFYKWIQNLTAAVFFYQITKCFVYTCIIIIILFIILFIYNYYAK